MLDDSSDLMMPRSILLILVCRYHPSRMLSILVSSFCVAGGLRTTAAVPENRTLIKVCFEYSNELIACLPGSSTDTILNAFRLT
jgi:hypothetical protein